MTRSQFILGTALLCVSGTLAFFISFREQESIQGETSLTVAPSPTAQRSLRTHRVSPLPLPQRQIEKMDATNYEVSVPDIDLQDLGRRIEADARQRLQKMTQRYQLSSNQRRELFPLLVSHHAEFQKGLVVNGSLAVSPSQANLASEVYLMLDLSQQEAYQESLLADNDWWGEIIGQLREDLDGALDAGEVDLISEPINTLPASSEAGRDDGGAIENEGINLGDFFGN